VACDTLTVTDLHERRTLHLAHRLSDRAAGAEAAARRRVGGRGEITDEHDALARPFRARIRERHRREQRVGVGVRRARVERLGVRELDEVAERSWAIIR
jgi:hypothetical protein